MNKTMILAMLVAYKAFNDKSLTIRVDNGEDEHVVNNAIIDNIVGEDISVSSCTYGGLCVETISVDDIVGIQFQK